MIKYFFLLSSTILFIFAEDGCRINIHAKPKNIEKAPTSSVAILVEEKLSTQSQKRVPKRSINITKNLKSVSVEYEGINLKITRVVTSLTSDCSAFYIEAMEIEGIKTVGELETLKFIEALGSKSEKLLLDVRSNKLYEASTIPGSLNLPYKMLADSSPYQAQVLKLLGAKKMYGKEKSQSVNQLLIFAEGDTSPHARIAIEHLLKAGYPKNKILYYRGGIENWKRLGLTVY